MATRPMASIEDGGKILKRPLTDNYSDFVESLPPQLKERFSSGEPMCEGTVVDEYSWPDIRELILEALRQKVPPPTIIAPSLPPAVPTPAVTSTDWTTHLPPLRLHHVEVLCSAASTSNPLQRLRDSSSTHSFTAVEESDLDESNGYFICAQHASGEIYVCIRGTKNVRDIFTDLSVFKSFDLRLVGNYHSGFMSRARLLPLATLEHYLRDNENATVTFCGHSLGGAVAKSAAVLAITTWRDIKNITERVRAVAINPPLFANEEALGNLMYGGRRASIVSVVTRCDLVPLLLDKEFLRTDLNYTLHPVLDMLERVTPNYVPVGTYIFLGGNEHGVNVELKKTTTRDEIFETRECMRSHFRRCLPNELQNNTRNQTFQLTNLIGYHKQYSHTLRVLFRDHNLAFSRDTGIPELGKRVLSCDTAQYEVIAEEKKPEKIICVTVRCEGVLEGQYIPNSISCSDGGLTLKLQSERVSRSSIDAKFMFEGDIPKSVTIQFGTVFKKENEKENVFENCEVKCLDDPQRKTGKTDKDFIKRCVQLGFLLKANGTECTLLTAIEGLITSVLPGKVPYDWVNEELTQADDVQNNIDSRMRTEEEEKAIADKFMAAYNQCELLHTEIWKALNKSPMVSMTKVAYRAMNAAAFCSYLAIMLASSGALGLFSLNGLFVITGSLVTTGFARLITRKSDGYMNVLHHLVNLFGSKHTTDAPSASYLEKELLRHASDEAKLKKFLDKYTGLTAASLYKWLDIVFNITRVKSELERFQLTAVCGTKNAGKSTFLEVLYGFETNAGEFNKTIFPLLFEVPGQPHHFILDCPGLEDVSEAAAKGAQYASSADSLVMLTKTDTEPNGDTKRHIGTVLGWPACNKRIVLTQAGKYISDLRWTTAHTERVKENWNRHIRNVNNTQDVPLCLLELPIEVPRSQTGISRTIEQLQELGIVGEREAREFIEKSYNVPSEPVETHPNKWASLREEKRELYFGSVSGVQEILSKLKKIFRENIW